MHHDHEIGLRIKTKQFYDHIIQKLGNSVKSETNPMSSFGLSEENMELSPIYQAVRTMWVVHFGNYSIIRGLKGTSFCQHYEGQIR